MRRGQQSEGNASREEPESRRSGWARSRESLASYLRDKVDIDFDLLSPWRGARLKVDSDLKAVIAHEAPKVARKFESVDDAIGALKTHSVPG